MQHGKARGFQLRSSAMTSARDLTRLIAGRVAAGELVDGEPLPSHRAFAAERGVSTATVARAYGLLAQAGVVRSDRRRLARIAAGGELAARGLLRGGRPFRLAGSDDPALDVLTQVCGDAIESVSASGSIEGFTALWKGRADGAAVHLLHRDGTYNAPYAAAVLAGREPVLVHLWRREQGILVAAGNPLGISGLDDLTGVRFARRRPGTGTRVLEERLFADAGVEAPSQGLDTASHLDVAFAVAAGLAEAGVAVRAAAQTLGLAFVPLTWEPFEIATTASALGGVEPLLAALRRPALRERINALGGYDLDEAERITYV